MVQNNVDAPVVDKKSKENFLLSLLFFVIIPVLVLNKLSSTLGPLNALLLSLSVSLIYGIYDYFKRKQASLIAVLGITSILIKGIFACFKVDGLWFAIQEAAIPTFLGIFTIVSAWIGKPFVNYFIYNENIFKIEFLESKLKEKKAENAFKVLMWQITMVFGCAFFLSGLLNFILAIDIIVSPSGTEAFNKELAEMTWKSYIVIALPKTVISLFGLWWFIFRLKKLTGLNASEILKAE
ncbi:VC0807 family protein [Silvanigrella aquatica]|uniref:MFS transporter n=1 Tax=Silvanigrella aquatica TaxID=1915309 RepID=A0A1L4D4S4_9BACT|nr:VC0807 family protein [Silvanigrella aquatica]APJ05182.1 hypothetical protein AXG55_12165 [Silvanigrella aquatica]